MDSKKRAATTKTTPEKNDNNSALAIVGEVLLLFLKMFAEVLISFVRLFVSPAEKDIKGEIVLITGAGHGIGRELALQFASQGATVVCVDINKKNNDQTAKDIAEIGYPKAYSYECDVSSRDAILEMIEKIKKDVGNVTMLVNNAGIMPTHLLTDHTEQEIKKIFDINVLAHFWLLQAVLPSMIEKNHGHIVALSSMAGIIGLKNLVPYCASKFAVRGMMEAMHEEIRESYPNNKINFTCIYPYMVDTGLCKKPKIRFADVMKPIAPKDAAKKIVRATRTNIRETSIPEYMLYTNAFFRMFPDKVAMILKEFLDSGLESDL